MGDRDVPGVEGDAKLHCAKKRSTFGSGLIPYDHQWLVASARCVGYGGQVGERVLRRAAAIPTGWARRSGRAPWRESHPGGTGGIRQAPPWTTPGPAAAVLADVAAMDRWSAQGRAARAETPPPRRRQGQPPGHL